MNVSETSTHFFLQCPKHTEARRTLQQVYDDQGIDLSIDSILLGDLNVNYEDNKILLDAVHRYMILTKRFANYL